MNDREVNLTQNGIRISRYSGSVEATWKIKANSQPVKSARISLHRAVDGKSVMDVTDEQGDVTLGLGPFMGRYEPLTLVAFGGDLPNLKGTWR